MKIAYIISISRCLSPYNGIRMQAETWAKELKQQGHEVILVNPWERHEWEDYDAIHIFGYCDMFASLSRVNTNIFFSPIIDSLQPLWKYRLATFWGNEKLRLMSYNYKVRKAKPYIRKWCARTQYEAAYISRGYDVKEENILIVPLSSRFPALKEYPTKKKYCLHVSSISQDRKNVERLIDAAIKYKFRLILAGNTEASFENSSMKKKINSNNNIEYIGRVTDEKLKELYTEAKVFALPSINEGVGLVALEAATRGCDIVITNIGGPKEYYDDMAFCVNPYDIDDIGKAVLNALEAKDKQPLLMKYVAEQYSLEYCVARLASCYAEGL